MWKQRLKFIGKNSSYELNSKLLKNCASGNLDDVLKILTDEDKLKKISFRFRDEEGHTALHLAVQNEHAEIARTLLEMAPNISSKKNKEGKTAIHIAVERDLTELIEMLINYHADIEALFNGMTPLMIAADLGHINSVKLLLKHGADRFAKTKRNKTAVDITANEEIRQLLDPSMPQSSGLDAEASFLAEISDEEQEKYNNLPIHEQYNLGRRIGEGAYASSVIATNLKYRYECVIKVLAANTLDDINDSLMEGLTLSLFKDCYRIVKFHDFYIDLPDQEGREEPFTMTIRSLTTSKRIKPGSKKGSCTVNLAMAWCKGGDVFTLVSNRLLKASEEEDRLEKEMYERSLIDGHFEAKEIFVEPEWFTEDEIVHITSQICEALVEIHVAHLIHRDIKPGNIFLDENQNVMLGDFGIAKFFESHDHRANAPAHTIVGSQNYMAHEMHDTSKPYTQAVDIFAVGCVIYFLVKFNHPNFFMRDAITAVLPEMQGCCTQFVYDMVERMWDRVPECRPTAEELLDWLKTRQVPPKGSDKHATKRPASPFALAPGGEDPPESDAAPKKKIPLRRRYAVGRLINAGANLYKARAIYNKKKYVMKRIPCNSMGELNEALQEASHLSHLRRHHHIVSFQDLFIDLTLKRELDPTLDPKENDVCDNSLSVCIVMQYCAEGDLEGILESYRKANEERKLNSEDGTYQMETVPEEHIIKWLFEAACGFYEIHKANIIHRNINTSNLFLDENFSLLIGDFATAKDMSVAECRTLVGSPEYMAPELMEVSNGSRAKPYGAAVDIFSLGVVLYQMLTLEPPVFGQQLEIPSHYSDFIRDLLHLILNQSPEKRPPAEKLKQILKAQHENPNASKTSSPYRTQGNAAPTAPRRRMLSPSFNNASGYSRGAPRAPPRNRHMSQSNPRRPPSRVHSRTNSAPPNPPARVGGAPKKHPKLPRVHPGLGGPSTLPRRLPRQTGSQRSPREPISPTNRGAPGPRRGTLPRDRSKSGDTDSSPSAAPRRVPRLPPGAPGRPPRPSRHGSAPNLNIPPNRPPGRPPSSPPLKLPGFDGDRRRTGSNPVPNLMLGVDREHSGPPPPAQNPPLRSSMSWVEAIAYEDEQAELREQQAAAAGSQSGAGPPCNHNSCGCTNFAPHRYLSVQCVNCYHKHQ